MGDISDDEKRQLVHQLLLQTPPGEFNATFNDVRSVCLFSSLEKRLYTPNLKWQFLGIVSHLLLGVFDSCRS